MPQTDYTMHFPGEWIITVQGDGQCDILYKGKRYTCGWHAVQIIKAAMYQHPNLQVTIY